MPNLQLANYVAYWCLHSSMTIHKYKKTINFLNHKSNSSANYMSNVVYIHVQNSTVVRAVISVRFVQKTVGGSPAGSAEDARMEAPQAPRGVRPTRGSGGAS